MRWMVLTLLAACAPDIGPLPGDDTDTDDTDTGDTDVPKPLITHEDEGAGITRTRVKATSATAWQGIDLDAPPSEVPLDPATDTDWDIAWQRFACKLNGGVSGAGGVEVAVVEGATLEDITDVPTDGWITDLPDQDEDGDDELAMWGWFEYDGASHVLTAKEQSYVVHTTSDRYVVLQVVAYYSDAGSSGYPLFRWRPLD